MAKQPTGFQATNYRDPELATWAWERSLFCISCKHEIQANIRDIRAGHGPTSHNPKCISGYKPSRREWDEITILKRSALELEVEASTLWTVLFQIKTEEAHKRERSPFSQAS